MYGQDKVHWTNLWQIVIYPWTWLVRIIDEMLLRFSFESFTRSPYPHTHTLTHTHLLHTIYTKYHTQPMHVHDPNLIKVKSIYWVKRHSSSLRQCFVVKPKIFWTFSFGGNNSYIVLVYCAPHNHIKTASYTTTSELFGISNTASTKKKENSKQSLQCDPSLHGKCPQCYFGNKIATTAQQ